MPEIYLNFTAGAGPRECHWVVVQAATALVSDAVAMNLRAKILREDETHLKEAESLLVRISGKEAQTFADGWVGTIRWIGTSPYRPHHKRKNWYIGVQKSVTPETVPSLLERDIRFQSMRARGPGGQHVNTTDSAVRVTHMPSGVSVVAMEERSQHANRKLARIKLATIFAEKEAERIKSIRTEAWRQNNALERGNEIACFQGPKFKRR